jgi:hypothetical protein
MQGLDRQANPLLLRMGQQRLDALADLLPRALQGLPGQSPADEHHERSTERRGLIDGLAIVLVSLAAACRVGVRKEAAAAERDDGQTPAP